MTSMSDEDFELFWTSLEDERLEDGCQTGDANQDAPVAQSFDSERQLEQPTFEEKCQRLRKVVNNKPGHREILRKTLVFCRDMHEFIEVEDKIQTYPEYPYADQNPFRLVKYLLDGGGLCQYDLDEEGNVISDEAKEGKNLDEIDDMIFSYGLETTEIGLQVANELDPKKRIQELFEAFCDRTTYYTELLEFCREPKTYRQIEELFKGRDLSQITTLHSELGLSIKPSVFVENMERAGALAWDGGWRLTKEGGEYLDKLLA